MEDSSDTFIESKSSDAADDFILPQSDDLIVAVSSPSNLTNDRSSGLVVAKNSTVEEIADMFKLIKISEPVIENTAGQDIEIKPCDAANEDDVLPPNDDLIVTVSPASIFNDNRSSGLVNGETLVQLGSVEMIVDKSRVEGIEEMSKLIKTPVPDANDATGKDLHLKTSDADSNAVLSHISDPIVAASSPSTLTDNQSSELVKVTSYEQIGTVEIVEDESAIEETDEKTKLIKTPEPDMEDTAGKDTEIKTSDATSNAILSQNEDLIIAVSSPSTLTDIQSSGFVKEATNEQVGTVEIVVDKLATEETDEKLKPDMEDTAGKDIEQKTFDSTGNVALSQNNDPIVTVSSLSTLTDNRSSEFVKETSYEQVGTVETLADESAIKETDENPKLIETPEPDMEDPAGKDTETKTSDATSNVVLTQTNVPIITVSSPSTLTDNRSSGHADETSYERIGIVEIVDKLAIEETDKKPKLIKTPEPDMDDTAGIDIEYKTFDAVNNIDISQSNDLIVTVPSPSTLTDNRSSGLVNETSYEPIGTVEIVADKLAIVETDEKPNLIKTPEPDFEKTAAKNLEIKTSNAANDKVLPQNDNLIIGVSSPSTLTDNQSAGLVKDTSYEQIGTVEIVADQSAMEETDEKLKLIKAPEPDMKDTVGKFIDIQTSDAASNIVLSQNNDLIVAVSFPSTLADHRSSGLVTDEETDEKIKAVDEETDEKPKPADEETDPKPVVEIDADKWAIKETDEMPKPTVEIDADKSVIEETDEKPKSVDGEIDEKPKPAVEIDADKSAIEETDEKPKPADEEIDEKPKPANEETDSKPAVEIDAVNLAIKQTDEKPIPAVEIDTDKSAIEETDEKPKPAVEIDVVKLATEETNEKPKPAVEIDVVKSAIKETDEKPKLIETLDPDMEDTAAKDIKIKTSNAANEEVLTHNVDAVVVSYPSKLAENRSSGLVSEESAEHLATDEIVDEMSRLIKTPEPEKCGKKPKFNLRKSLAWDSAFFTSDGVLDADELSTMIEGGDKGVKHHLPGIEEEVYRSMDSLSSLASDNLSLECLEAELFDDIRASIQKSNRVSNLNNSNIKVSSGKKDIQPKISNPSKKVDPDNWKRPAVRIKDNTSGIPQPKITSRVNSTSTLSKRATLSANNAKKEQDIAKQAQVSLKGPQALKTTLGSKVTGAIGPRRGVPKPMLNSKSSMLASSSSTAPKMDPTRPSSSCSNSSSCSSGTDVKTSTSLSRKKVDSKAGKVNTGSIAKAPSRIISKNKQATVDSRLSSRSVVSNLPKSISPASSVSEWDSDSSSSNQRCSIDTGASFRSSVESASSIHLTDQKSNQNGNQTVVLNASQTGPLSRPPSVQPTGLRMPSPKIGFFDGGKSGVRTPTGGVRTGPTSSNGSKIGKIPLPKTAAPTNLKPNLQKMIPKLAQEQQSSKLKAANASQGVKSFLVPPKQANLGNKSVSKIDTADCSRAPFAVKNSVSAANGSDVHATEKTVNLSFVETQHKENSELI